jgi:hypothetical protein
MVETHKSARLAYEAETGPRKSQRQRIAARWRERREAETDLVHPPLGDVFEYDAVKTLVGREQEGTLPMAEIDAALTAFEATIPQCVCLFIAAPVIHDECRWTETTQAALVELAGAEDASALDLACFTCRVCKFRVVWPFLLRHICLRQRHLQVDDLIRPYNIAPLNERDDNLFPPLKIAAAFDVDLLGFDDEQTVRLTKLADNLAGHALLKGAPPTHVTLDALGARFKGGTFWRKKAEIWDWAQLVRLARLTTQCHWSDFGQVTNSLAHRPGFNFRTVPVAPELLDDAGLAEIRRAALKQVIDETCEVHRCPDCGELMSDYHTTRISHRANCSAFEDQPCVQCR